jgi:outer membrane lipoprotein-sorting protein
MKKTIFILMLVFCLFLSGCRESIEQLSEETELEIPAGPSDVKEESKGAEGIPAPKPQMSDELKELLDKSKTVESLKYFYQSGYDNIWFYVRGSRIKQEFPFEMIDNIYYDTAYLDTNKKTAVLYCEDDNSFYCEADNQSLDVDYNNYISETPLDVLKLIVSGDVKPGTLFDSKETVIYETKTKEGYDTKIWLWTYRGIPLKYEVWDNNERIKWVNYNSLSVNTVSVSDVVH